MSLLSGPGTLSLLLGLPRSVSMSTLVQAAALLGLLLRSGKGHWVKLTLPALC